MNATTVKERPILFSGPMVNAIRRGAKTQTRRILKHGHLFRFCPGGDLNSDERRKIYAEAIDWTQLFGGTMKLDDVLECCPYGQSGNQLWVKEAFCQKIDDDGRFVYNASGNLDPSCFHYQADGVHVVKSDGDGGVEYRKDGREASPWVSSRFMPRAACRIVLEVVSVRVERLQDISRADILAEGVVERGHRDQFGLNPVSVFDGGVYMDLKSLWEAGWDKINGKRGFAWESNPWVWAVEFKQAKGKA